MMRNFNQNYSLRDVIQMEQAFRKVREENPEEKHLDRSDYFVRACKALESWALQWETDKSFIFSAADCRASLILEPARRIAEVPDRNFGNNVVLLRSIHVREAERKKGYGKEIMSQLVGLSEKRSVPILLIVKPFELRESAKGKMLCEQSERDICYCLDDERIESTKGFFRASGFREITNLDWNLSEKCCPMIYIPEKYDLMIENFVKGLEFGP